MEENTKRGKLYIVSTHIGNKEDVTIRAIEVLKLADLVVCEELKVGSILLKDLKINKKLDTLNEQNEDEKIFEYIKMIQEDDKKLALISDCGTPIFADPGYKLIKAALAVDVNVIVVPGVTSLMAALVRSGFPLTQFLYAGFLSRKSEDRIKELIALSKESRTVAIYDTPYRLLPLLEDASKIMPYRKVYIGMNLTMPYETHHYGTFLELFEKFKEARIKAEFVICFEGVSAAELTRKFSYHKDEFPADKRFSNRSNSNEKFQKFGNRTGNSSRFSSERPSRDKKYQSSKVRSNTPLDRARNTKPRNRKNSN